MPKVSVIIPAYNAMNYLPKTLESVLKQTFDDFEVILVNDGSSDGIEDWTAQIIDRRVKLISQENKGLAVARNTGINHSQGDYLAFLDADDIWEPTKLEKQVICLAENSELGLVYTWTAWIDENDNFTGRILKSYAEGYIWQKLITYNVIGCGSVAMVRRSCFDTVGIFDSNLTYFNVNEDWDMWLRIADRYPFKVIKEPLVYYRQSSSSSSRNWHLMEQSFSIVIEKAFSSAPAELFYLKGQSYGSANLCLAWKALQSRDKDYKKAIYFRAAALAQYPWVCFSKEYLSLSLAIILMRWLGGDLYKKLLRIFYFLRRRLIPIGR